MNVRILYFAGLREAMGRSQDFIQLPPEINTVGKLRGWLAERGNECLMKTKNLRYAVNQDMASLAADIKENDEIAFFPPVTGG
jgi:molybdopterin synthase sulfur carrier subunit